MEFYIYWSFSYNFLIDPLVVHHVCPSFRKFHVPSHTLNTHAVLAFG